MGHAVNKDGLVIDPVKLVSNLSIDVDFHSARREFRDNDTDRSRSDDKLSVGLLDIERSASEVIGLIAGVNLNCAFRWLRKRGANRRIHFLEPALCGLIVNSA